MKLALCRGEVCTRHGAAALAAFAQGLLGVGWNETTADGAVTLAPTDCIGLCNGAPCGALDGLSLVWLTSGKLQDRLIAKGKKAVLF